MWTWHEGTLVRVEKQCAQTQRFWLQVDDTEAIHFKAGQFVTMDLPIHERRRQRWRSYSIANPPDGSNLLEFSIVRLDNGLATTYLFDKLKLGDTIKFKGPEGTFVLPSTLSSDLVFVCTGTGVAPFRSMIFDLINHKKAHPKIHLIFGTRYEEGILYREEFEQLQAECSNFKYTPVLSRQPDWAGYQGYVHQVYEEQYANQADLHFYLCGWQAMIDEARNRLQAMNIPKANVFYELYG